MQLVEGEDLSQRIGRGAIPVDEAVGIALQIAEALEAAHEKGIVHRDLKPANVKVTPEGTIKVLDFGLAKALANESAEISGNASLSPTLTAAGTRAGVILGTAAYMSPEQARGKPVDKRADIWAFGAVLYEMLTGRRLFSGETISDIIAAVLRAEPDWAALPAATPTAIRALLRRCLTREPKARQRDIGDARIVLQEVLAGESQDLATRDGPTAAPRRAPVIVWIAGIVAAAVAGSLVSRTLLPDPTQPTVKMVIPAAVNVAANFRDFTISPDGKKLAYSSAGMLWVRSMDDVTPSALGATEGALGPFWSPDSRQIGYVSGERLWRIRAAGGSPMLVCRLPGPFAGAAWRADGSIVFSQTRGPLWSVSAQGGDPEVLLALSDDDVDFHMPSSLPDGKGLLFSVHRPAGVDRIVLFDGVARKVLLEVEAESGLSPQVLNYPCYSPTGHLVYRRDQGNTGVWAVPFDLARAAISGEPFPVAPGGHFPSVSRTGVLSYTATTEGGPVQLAWVDRAGQLLETVGEPLTGLTHLALSPEDRRLAVVLSEGGNRDIWVLNPEEETRTRLTFTSEDEASPAWSPDGRWIAYSCSARGDTSGTPARTGWTPAICRRAADGSGDREVLTPLGRTPVFEPGGESLLYVTSGGSRRAVMRLALDGSSEPEIVHETTPWSVTGVSVSPDGRYMIYSGDEGGRIGARIMPLDGRDGKWELPGHDGFWSPSGTEIFYTDVDDGVALFAIPVEIDSAVTLGRGEQLFNIDIDTGSGDYGVSADGKRILVLQTVEKPSGPAGITVIHNWYSEFRDDLR